MAFDETYRTYIITQYPRVTTFYRPDDDRFKSHIRKVDISLELKIAPISSVVHKMQNPFAMHTYLFCLCESRRSPLSTRCRQTRERTQRLTSLEAHAQLDHSYPLHHKKLCFRRQTLHVSTKSHCTSSPLANR
jgi:hypothetical protein